MFLRKSISQKLVRVKICTCKVISRNIKDFSLFSFARNTVLGWKQNFKTKQNTCLESEGTGGNLEIILSFLFDFVFPWVIIYCLINSLHSFSYSLYLWNMNAYVSRDGVILKLRYKVCRYWRLQGLNLLRPSFLNNQGTERKRKLQDGVLRCRSSFPFYVLMAGGLHISRKTRIPFLIWSHGFSRRENLASPIKMN